MSHWHDTLESVAQSLGVFTRPACTVEQSNVDPASGNSFVSRGALEWSGIAGWSERLMRQLTHGAKLMRDLLAGNRTAAVRLITRGPSHLSSDAAGK